ncbi:hypothetical protein Pst134EA_032578 [Puccinia striiformis f. sp. tritici]|uniref:uncharacterized protein n=1 Tax=Puccinia striiformis f. sp. tritici TaxID=168172 RepID=UPI0020087C88|nr:uncharacterized protein Pst134EA_032578 [Puccinia striiformis f. sp. tritici]KAH9443587.1 hypothetical protein Pst134EA_032578 [Puccinia striiformis f. sp. tritici]
MVQTRSQSDLSILSNNPAETSEHHSREEKHSTGSPAILDGKTGPTSQPPLPMSSGGLLCSSLLSAGATNQTPKPVSWVPGSPVTAVRHPPRARRSIGDSHVKPNAIGSATPRSAAIGKIIPAPSPSPSPSGSKHIPKVLSEDSRMTKDMDLDDDEDFLPEKLSHR